LVVMEETCSGICCNFNLRALPKLMARVLPRSRVEPSTYLLVWRRI